MEQTINRIRFYHYISGILNNQSNDPLRRRCKPFANTVKAMKDELLKLNDAEPDDLSPEITKLIEKAKALINSLEPPKDTEGQKKAGNCNMPKRVCFVKSSKALL